MAEHANIGDVYDRIVSIEGKVDEVVGEFAEVREDINDLSDRITEIERWRAARDGVIRSEIEAYHTSPAFQLVLASAVIPAMRASMKQGIREAVTWKKVTGAMAVLGSVIALVNQILNLASRLGGLS